MLVVNTNVNSLKAQRDLSRTRSNLSMAMQRISSGLRINSARDDAAGIGITQRMTSQIKGLSMAMKNANDGISFVQTAEGALQEVTTLLQRIQELAGQASSGANNPADHFALQSQMLQLNAEVTRIADETEFNGLKLLSGDIVNAEFQVGIRSEQTIKVSIAATDSTNIGNYSTFSNNTTGLSAMGAARLGDFEGEAPQNFVQDQVLTIRGFSSDIVASNITVSFEETARSIVAKINGTESRSGVSATGRTEATLEQVYDAGTAGTQTVSFRLYGKNAKAGIETNNAAFITASIEGETEEGLAPLISAINAQFSVTGITASFSEGKILLVEGRGENISIEGFSNANADPLSISEMLVTGMQGTAQQTLVEASATDSVTVGGIVTLNSPKPFTVTSDAVSDNSLFQIGFEGALQGAEFSRLSDISLLSVEEAAVALRVTSSALDFISSLRGSLGSLQNRFESTIANLGSVRENAEAARGRVEDADFAEETARLTKAQILQEAGIAILAQANTIPQTVLALLRA